MIDFFKQRNLVNSMHNNLNKFNLHYSYTLLLYVELIEFLISIYFKRKIFDKYNIIVDL